MNDEESIRPLARLVRERQQQWSYREMEARARRRGHDISHSQLADYAKDVVRTPPKQEQIEALAAALDVGIVAVLTAVWETWYGFEPAILKRIGNSKGSRIGAAVPPDLSAAEEEELLRLVDAWVAARRKST